MLLGSFQQADLFCVSLLLAEILGALGLALAWVGWFLGNDHCFLLVAEGYHIN
jgi:hypothetical protein